jgi:hypothetical protein
MMNEELKMLKATPLMIRFVKMLPADQRITAALRAEHVYATALAQLTRFDDFGHEQNVAMALEAAEAELAYMANQP